MSEIETLEKGTVTSPLGYTAAATASGLKKERRPDLTLLHSKCDCTAAAVFTKNQVVAAPVILDRETLQANDSALRGVVANAGNANACTGEPGYRAAQQMQQSAAFALGFRPEQVLVLSTGVIGVQMPMPQINAGIDAAARRLARERGADVAEAIMTTDTFPKQMAVRLDLPEGSVTIGGVAKGAGMIHPDMATMLAVITTDAAVPAGDLRALLGDAVKGSFNRISVDGDTSTNDTVLLLANGASGVTMSAGENRAAFARGLNYVCTELAKMIVRDGEGATKFVEIRVTGAEDEATAHAVAETIATSALVKTALAGGDANWGRVLAAAGRAGVPLDQRRLALTVAQSGERPLQLVDGGAPTGYEEEDAAAIFAGEGIVIHLDLGQGDAETTMWTCDLTHDYVSINADYRT